MTPNQKAKLPVTSGRKVIKALEKEGFYPIRTRGDHVRLRKDTPLGPVFVSVPLHKVIKKGTLRNIIRQAGLTVEEFMLLL